MGNAADEATPEIEDLARGLLGDPLRIYEFVFNHIDYDHYFGSRKGATLTLLEGSGNDFDQCALLVALLRAAGHSASYRFGLPVMPYESADGRDLKSWLGLKLPNANFNATASLLAGFLGYRGFPLLLSAGDGNSFAFHRMWVVAEVGGQEYVLDPAFKRYEWLGGIDLTNAMGFSRSGLLSVLGGSTNLHWATGLKERLLRSNLNDRVEQLLGYLQTNHPNATVEEIAGGRRLVPVAVTNLPTALAFPVAITLDYEISPGVICTVPVPPETTTAIPETYMSRLAVGIGAVTNEFLMPALQGRRLALTFETTNAASLWLEDTLLTNVALSGASSTVDVALLVDNPYGEFEVDAGCNWSITNEDDGDQGVSASYQRALTNGIPRYVISYAFKAGPELLRRRQEKLDAYLRAGLTNGTRQVVTETLNLLGLRWLWQSQLSDQFFAAQRDLLWAYHHRVGRAAQEQGYYVDIFMQLSGNYPAGGDWSRFLTGYAAAAFIGSALEHGVLQQSQQTHETTVSTVKILKIVNDLGTNDPVTHRVYLLTSNNFASVSSELVGYSPQALALFGARVTNGAYLLVSRHAGYQINQWAGSGLVVGWPDSYQMIIGGGYNGGFQTVFGQVSGTYLRQDSAAQPGAFRPGTVTLPMIPGADPVDLATGAFTVDRTDLQTGGAEPRGITFSRHYSSNRRHHDPTRLGYGWTHNWDIRAVPTSAPEAALGRTTPAQMATFLVAGTAAMAVYEGSTTAKERLAVALIADWAVQRMVRPAISVIMGKDTVQFFDQPRGIFTPPAGVTMQLTLNTNTWEYELRERNGRTFFFYSDTLAEDYRHNRLREIRDPYGKSLTLDYHPSHRQLEWIKDAFGRHLTFTYNLTNGAYFLQTVAEAITNYPSRKVSFQRDPAGRLTGARDAETNLWHYHYDADHKITGLRDPLGRTITTNFYDALGRVMEQHSEGDPAKAWKLYYSGVCNVEEDPAGGRRCFFFDDKLRPTGLIDANGHRTTVRYDGQDHVIEQVSPLLETNRFLYDGFHNLVGTIDPLEHTTSNRYDSLHRLTNAIDARNLTNHYEYNPFHQVTKSIDPRGHSVQFTYHPSNATAQAGLLASRTDQTGGHTTTYAYDGFGLLSQITHPGNVSEYFLNHPRGDATNHTDANGNTTAFLFNDRRELRAQWLTNHFTNTLTYDAAGNLWKTTNALGHGTTNEYSATRKILRTRLPGLTNGAPVLTNGYDARDWLVVTANPLTQKSRFIYDAAQRMIAIDDPLERTSRFAYDDSGRRLTAVNPLLLTNRSVYNARGEMVASIDPTNNPIQYFHDANGNRTNLINRREGLWQFAHDPQNRLTNTLSPLLKRTATHYNSRGLVEKIIEPSNQETTFTYDSRGRLESRTDGVATNTVFTYDNNNNLLTVTENGKTKTRVYDARNRVTSYADGEGNTIGYRYDAAGNLTNLIYPGGQIVTNFYDSHNRLTNVTDWAGRQTVFHYDLAGRVRKIIRPNGTSREVIYDEAGQTREIWERKSDGTPIALFKLQWDEAGRVEHEFIAPLPKPYTEPGVTATYDADNRIATWNGTGVNHDADGNLTRGPVLGGPWLEHDWTARNQLAQIWTNVGVINIGTQAEYSYDSEGYRITADEGPWVLGPQDPLTIPKVSRRFVIDPQAALSRVLHQTKTVAGAVPPVGPIPPPTVSHTFYVYGLGLLYEVDESGDARYYHYDYRGSTVAITDAAQTVTDRVEYSPYGVTTHRTGATDTPFLFNGRYGVQTDPNGLLHMRARYYNPHLKRFLNPDPLGFSGGMNFYAFADGNPISYLDPFGLGAQEPDSTVGYWLRQGGTVGVGLIPVVGSVQSVVELFTGYDYITGERTSRSLAAVGIVAGVLPGGKGLLKGGAKVISHADEVLNLTSAAKGGVRAFEVGPADDLLARSLRGDKLDIHHVGQAHPFEQIIPGYNRATAPAIAVPRAQHSAIPTVRGPYTGTARDQLAKDIRDLRNYTDAPNSALRELIELNKQMYPNAFQK